MAGISPVPAVCSHLQSQPGPTPLDSVDFSGVQVLSMRVGFFHELQFSALTHLVIGETPKVTLIRFGVISNSWNAETGMK